MSGLEFLRRMQYKDNAAAEAIDQEAEAGIAGAQTQTLLSVFLFPLIGTYMKSGCILDECHDD